MILIDDCYNANPMSMQAALADLAATAGGERRRVAVLGDMLELGAEERRYHAELGRQAQGAGVDLLIAVGPLAAEAAKHFDGESRTTQDAREAATVTRAVLAPGDVVLVKASRGIGLEAVCQALQTEWVAR
jgi:UDP-N-acetylmuramoyl-tripeptide--D-alanyl-D-alanine ligase